MAYTADGTLSRSELLKLRGYEEPASNGATPAPAPTLAEQVPAVDAPAAHDAAAGACSECAGPLPTPRGNHTLTCSRECAQTRKERRGRERRRAKSAIVPESPVREPTIVPETSNTRTPGARLVELVSGLVRAGLAVRVEIDGATIAVTAS